MIQTLELEFSSHIHTHSHTHSHTVSVTQRQGENNSHTLDSSESDCRLARDSGAEYSVVREIIKKKMKGTNTEDCPFFL